VRSVVVPLQTDSNAGVVGVVAPATFEGLETVCAGRVSVAPQAVTQAGGGGRSGGGGDCRD